MGFEKWIGFLSAFVAPLTLVTTLLFYFGYVSTREYFRYFGIDVDLLEFSSQDFVMRSPGALFVPVMILLLLTAALILGHRMLRRRLIPAPPTVSHRVVTGLATTGGLLVLAGLALAFLAPALGGWGGHPFVTPLVLAVGAGISAYAAATADALTSSPEGRSVVVILVLVMVAGTFWASATLAQWWGTGQARNLAADLTTLPAVVLDTGERLYPGNDAILFQSLQPATAAAEEPLPRYRYRYSGLRLLVHGAGDLYLVPDAWTPDASTLVVPDTDDIRVRYRFLPDANG